MRDPPRSAYFAYDANLGTMTPSDRLARRRGKPCPHDLAKGVGGPMFDVRRYLECLDRPAPSELEAQPRPQPIGPRWSIGAVAGWFRKMIGL
jgi:molybdopterin-synthase adenylyltransferase